MFAGKWGGTMCLTEPHSGSDVGAAKSTAAPNGDGTYNIRGTKIFISAGGHDRSQVYRCTHQISEDRSHDRRFRRA